MHNLANALWTGSQQTGQTDDLDEAILLHREALALLPSPHPLRFGSLHNLANTLRTRFQQTGRTDNFEEAILLHREALTLCPAPHAGRSMLLNSLANSLLTRFEQKGHTDDLEDAILLQREALTPHSAPHDDRSRSLNNLANALSARFEQNGLIDDLKEAILLRREVLMCLPPSHPRHCLHLRELASSLCDKFGLGDKSSLEISMDMFRTATNHETGSVLDRLDAAQRWVKRADAADHSSSLEAYQAAVQLLPYVVMLASDARSRHRLLADRLGYRGLWSDAAACAIRSGKLAQAVEILEEDRSIFWSQALQLRTPLDDLHHASPELAKRLQEIAATLERSAFREVSVVVHTDVKAVMTMEAEALQSRRLNEERLAILEEVRALNGFEEFLRPKMLASLKRAAVHGPVVLLNLSTSSCDALIVNVTGVEHVPLTQLTEQQAVLLDNSLLTAMTSFSSFANHHKASFESLLEHTQTSRGIVHDRKAGHHQKVPLQNVDDVLRSVLAVLWKLVVNPVTRHLKLEVRLCSYRCCALCSALTRYAEI